MDESSSETHGSPVLTTDTGFTTNSKNGWMKPTQIVISAAKSQRPTNFGVIPLPKRLVYDPERPAHFGFLLKVVFYLSSTFIVSNLYYCQPLLIEFSKSFNVTYEEVSKIPTLVKQGPHASGLFLISPLGDLVKRRPLLLLLCSISASLTAGLAVTRSLVVFQILCFFIGATSMAPAADLAPESKRASAISIVFSGLLFGVLIARVLAGIIAQYVTWRVVYYLAIGVQCAVIAMLWATIPDFPAKNRNITYVEIICTMARLAVTEPRLIQASLIGMASSACFTCYWVTLTFLLGGPPYHYSTLVIGLFGLLGMSGTLYGPTLPWYTSLFAGLLLLAMQVIYFGAAGVNVAAVVIQMQQVSQITSVYGISQAARARLNAVLIISIFIGQAMGSSVGTKLFVSHGWRASGGLMLGWTALQLLFLLLRGPHCDRYTWFGVVEGHASDIEMYKGTKQVAAEEASKDEKQIPTSSNTSSIVS
ncbi:major facilitator superfamily domain-containing protein [Lactarius quietus]|nr:major facilitator superfamily domain-containing protein [Lactarius quietus]